MKVFTAQQMREFDRTATEEYGIPSIVLMENAALRVVEFLEMKFGPLHEKTIVVLCGKGNNGGDGLAIARHLLNTGAHVIVPFIGDPATSKNDAQTNANIVNIVAEIEMETYGRLKTFQLNSSQTQAFYDLEVLLKPSLTPQPAADILIDAWFGTGFSRPITDPFLQELQELWCESSLPKIAVDIPSGLNADTGKFALIDFSEYDFARSSGGVENAAYTVTFAGPKRGMFLRDGIEKCGEIWVGSIGTSPAQMDSTRTGCECLTREISRALLPSRSADAHKGDAGRVVLIGGSTGMSGAPTLAAKTVLKSGAGLCIAALPGHILPSFASAFPEATSHPLPCSSQGSLTEEAVDKLPPLWENVHAVAIGPGISRDPEALKLVQHVVRECPQPLVIDADALYALREIEADLKKRTAPTVLTPHPGEMGELMEMKTSEVQENRIETAIACAQKYNAIVVLKGARSIVALPSGDTYINLTGNSGMASGGSGDVLTGTIAGLLPQLEYTNDAVRLGVYLHGLAGDLAFAEKGNGLLAGDIAENLPRALLELSKSLEPPANARLWKLE